MNVFSLRAMLDSQPADEQPPAELVVRMEAVLYGVDLSDYPRPWGGGSIEDQDLRLELNSADEFSHVVIRLGVPEYIYYSYRRAGRETKVSEVKKPVTAQTLQWVLDRLAELRSEHDGL